MPQAVVLVWCYPVGSCLCGVEEGEAEKVKGGRVEVGE